MAKFKTQDLRINSLQDAQSAVQNQLAIINNMKKKNIPLLQIFVANEVKAKVMPLFAGIFPVKVSYKAVQAAPDSELFVLPPYKER